MLKFRERTIEELADMICGNVEEGKPSFFKYRSSFYLTRFFRDCDTEYRHDGSTRGAWVSDVLKQILLEPQAVANALPETFVKVIYVLMDQEDAKDEPDDRPAALAALNRSLGREGYQAEYGPDRRCYGRHVATNFVSQPSLNPHRPLTPLEIERRSKLTTYLDKASEDEFIAEVLLPLFRQLGFTRITSAGHKDKLLEFGNDVWMRHVLPTMHVLYFGIQVKKGKIDAAGVSKGSNANVGELLNQATMMLGKEVFDAETGRTALVDHAFIISAGEITKQARLWIGHRLDIAKRSQLMFMDRDDILNLYTVSPLSIPGDAPPPKKAPSLDDDIPF